MLTLHAPGANGGELVAAQFERVGGRASTLAVWFLDGDQLAPDLVVEAPTPLGTSHAITPLSEAQRTVIELVLLGRLDELAPVSAPAAPPGQRLSR